MNYPNVHSQNKRPAIYRRLLELPEEDPLNGVANLFDVAMVFAVTLLLALVSYQQIPEFLSEKDNIAIGKKTGKPRLEIVKRKGVVLDRYRVSKQKMGGRGERLGTAYRLATGEVVYVPENR